MARPGLTGHRKFRRLARALGSAMVARGALELLWESCYEAGDDYVGTADDIEHLVGWTGASSVLTSALADAGQPEGAGFIELAGERQGYRVHDLWHHAPDYVTKRRQRELTRQQKTAPNEPRRRTALNGAENTETLKCLDGVDRTPSPSPSPSPKAKNVSPESHNDSEPKALLTFPIDGIGGPTWLLSEAQVAEWATLFPSLDVMAECRHSLAWVRAKPSRRKTARGMPAFLVGWLTRSNDRGRSNGKPEEQAVKPDWYGHVPHCRNEAVCMEKFLRETKA